MLGRVGRILDEFGAGNFRSRRWQWDTYARNFSFGRHRLCRTASADSSPTRVGSGRTAVRAKAAIPYRVRNRLYGPERASIETPAEHVTASEASL